MKRNVKILAWALITAMTATSIWVSFADNSAIWTFNSSKKFVKQQLTTEQKAEMEVIRAILDKKRNLETLTADEQVKLDNFKANKPNFGWKWIGRWDFMNWERGGFMTELTTEEKNCTWIYDYWREKSIFWS